jgi:pimeloyl-ACP methyl ester carboxylesterase
MCAFLQSDQSAPREGYISVENAELYYREIGQGQPIIILHGGPDFDHNYLLYFFSTFANDPAGYRLEVLPFLMGGFLELF